MAYTPEELGWYLNKDGKYIFCWTRDGVLDKLHRCSIGWYYWEPFERDFPPFEPWVNSFCETETISPNGEWSHAPFPTFNRGKNYRFRKKDVEKEVAKALDVQTGGDHYKKTEIQPVEYIHANGLGYFEGNVVKYVTRHQDKGKQQDLEKAIHYLQLLIELEYKEDN